MYIPKHFEESRVEVLHNLVRMYPFGSLVTSGSAGLIVNHLPFVIRPEPKPYGTLRGHVARANPVWQELSVSIESVVVFQGPQAYISPSWYPSKAQHGKVVPTWNYVTVHAYGSPRAVEDIDWLTEQLADLTDLQESSNPRPWKINDAPKDYLDKMLQAIVGIEIPIGKIMGKWKLSQNRPNADRRGVIAALNSDTGQGSKVMAEFMRKVIS